MEILENEPNIILKDMRPEEITYQVCIDALSKNSQNLLFIPKQFFDDNMIRTVIDKCIFLDIWDYIPENLVTWEHIKYAVDSCFVFRDGYVPEKFKTYQFWKYVLESSSDEGCTGLRNIPDEHKTKQLCEYALQINSGNIMFVPERFITQQMCDNLVFSEEELMVLVDMIPRKYINQIMCNGYVKRFPLSVLTIPYKYRTEWMWKRASEYNHNVKKHVPECYHDRQWFKDKNENTNSEEPLDMIIQYNTQSQCKPGINFAYPGLDEMAFMDQPIRLVTKLHLDIDPYFDKPERINLGYNHEDKWFQIDWKTDTYGEVVLNGTKLNIHKYPLRFRKGFIAALRYTCYGKRNVDLSGEPPFIG